jgi:hypothetical protein
MKRNLAGKNLKEPTPMRVGGASSRFGGSGGKKLVVSEE